MADAQNANVFGIVDKRMPVARTRTNPQAAAFASDTKDVGALRTRLTAADAAYYTNARLNAMTFNDLVYAVRTLDEAGSI